MGTSEPLILEGKSSRAAQARLWQLVSPALPVGGYSYSQGLESACALGWVASVDQAADWILSVGWRNLTALDLPVLAAQSAAVAVGDVERWRSLNQLLRAHRESSELRAEDAQSGRALLKLLSNLELGDVDRWHAADGAPTFAGAFALAGAALALRRDDLLSGYAWVWFENQVAAAIKLVPLGQSEGQRLLLRCGSELDGLLAKADEVDLAEIGSTLPGLALASAAHETQYSRLFRS